MRERNFEDKNEDEQRLATKALKKPIRSNVHSLARERRKRRVRFC